MSCVTGVAGVGVGGGVSTGVGGGFTTATSTGAGGLAVNRRTPRYVAKQSSSVPTAITDQNTAGLRTAAAAGELPFAAAAAAAARPRVVDDDEPAAGAPAAAWWTIVGAGMTALRSDVPRSSSS